MISRLARPFFGALLVAAIALAATTSPAAAAPPPSDQAYSEARILWLLNEERRMHGLGPVQNNGGAHNMAQHSANVQAWNGRLGHNPNLAHDVTRNVARQWWWAAENVGCGGDADHLHSMWMRSAGHRANMLRPAADAVGIGTLYARGCLWATVVFVDR